MNRREFMCLVAGLVSGLMIESPRPIVRIPNRPRIGPLPPPTPLSPDLLAYLDSLSCPPAQIAVVAPKFPLAKIELIKPDGTWVDLGSHMIEDVKIERFSDPDCWPRPLPIDISIEGNWRVDVEHSEG